MDNKRVFADNLQDLIDKKGKSRRGICADLGIGYSTLTEWMQGKKFPRIDKLEKLAEYFGVSKSELIEPQPPSMFAGYRPPANTSEERMETMQKLAMDVLARDMVQIPVLGSVAGGHPRYAEGNIIGSEYISAKDASRGECFALKVTGESMYPLIQDGDIIVVRAVDDVESGDVAVVVINGDEATVKRVMKDEKGITLIAENEEVYSPKRYSNYEIMNLPVTIAGEVLFIRRDLK